MNADTLLTNPKLSQFNDRQEFIKWMLENYPAWVGVIATTKEINDFIKEWEEE